MNKISKIILAAFGLFFALVFYRNFITYHSMQNNAGYTPGRIIKVWNNEGWYSRYRYTVNGKVFYGMQGEKYAMDDTVLIVYDSTRPRYGMITEYPLPVLVDSNNNLVNLDTARIKYSWWDYLPGDEANSIVSFLFDMD